MTKEELYEKLGLPGEMYAADTEKYLDEFFESNVCIPKGADRDSCADVLHEWIEGAYIQQNYGSGWVDMDSVSDMFIAIDCRIKPSEPILEYQWLDFNDHKEGYFLGNRGFYTEQEAKSLTVYRREVKIEETKRERK